MKKVAYKVLMWWCIALVIIGVVLAILGNTWGILQAAISAGIAYSAYRKVKNIEKQVNEKYSGVSYIFPDKVELGDDEYLEKFKISDEFREAIGLKEPLYVKKKRKKKE